MFSSVTLGKLVAWTEGAASKNLPVRNRVPNISTDSRTLVPGDTFIAIKGETFDGHDFLIKAIEKGAMAIVAERELPAEMPSICVPDSLSALVSIGQGQRELFNGRTIAITGSAGKSSTKEMVATLFGTETVASPASFNNLIGVSKTLCLVTDTTRQLVLEMGMNAPNEIATLCSHFKPHYGLITNIGDAHLGKLGSSKAIYLAKRELFDWFSRSICEGIAINSDDANVVRAYQESGCGTLRCPVVRYSVRPGARVDVCVLSAKFNPKTSYLDVELSVAGDRLKLPIPIFGCHHVQNLVAAVSLARLCQIPLHDIAERARGIRPASHRGMVLTLAHEITLIDDCYNSNPTALLSSLETLMQADPQRRLVIVLGEMRELGEYSSAKHQHVGEQLCAMLARRMAPSVVIGVGPDTAPLLSAIRLTKATAHQVPNVENSLELCDSVITSGDLVFVKGSRGVHLDKLVLHIAASKNL